MVFFTFITLYFFLFSDFRKGNEKIAWQKADSISRFSLIFSAKTTIFRIHHPNSFSLPNVLRFNLSIFELISQCLFLDQDQVFSMFIL